MIKLANEFDVRRPVLVVVMASLLPLAGSSQSNASGPQQSPNTLASKANFITPPDLTGVYAIIPDGSRIPLGLKNIGSPENIPLQPSAMAAEKKQDVKKDPAKNCQPIGPFRMMARPGTKIDILPSPNRITILFENIALGHFRTIYLDRAHPDKGPTNADGLTGTWEGDSIGHWQGDTLVVDTNDFETKGYTWLNDAGATHSDALHLIEMYRLIDGGKYLELKLTADDPKTLTKPYSYTRYFERVQAEIREDFCQEDE